MKSCKNCIYSYFCYKGKEVKELSNINFCCSGYVKEVKVIRNNKKTKEK